jgi:diguanylate cyclase (GGDEF)-like protein
MEGRDDLGQHFAGTCSGLLLRHVARKAGDAAVAEVLRRASVGLSEEELHDDTRWVSYDEFRSLLEAAAAVLGGPRPFDDLHELSLLGGSMPEATEMLQALGSPGVLFKAVEDGNGIMSAISGSGLVHEVSDTEFDLGYRFLPGFEPFPAFCSFMTGLNGMTPRLFGLQIEVLEEHRCVFRGDDHCAVFVRWQGADDESELALLRMKLTLSDQRMAAFRDTVTDLVSDDDLETVLQRAVSSAARAMRAPAFVLALEPLPWRSKRVFAHGMDDDSARAVAGALLDESAVAPAAFVVDVASTKRHYGRLAAVDVFGNVSEVDLPVLGAYARLAATALDSAMALEESRRQAASARALLTLSRELADVTSMEQMAANVARATPMVIDCDLVTIVLIDDDQVARIKGTHGFDPDVESFMLQVEFPVDDRVMTGFELHTIEDAAPDVRAVMAASQALALATVPVLIDGATAGCVVVAVRDTADRLTDNPEIEEQLGGLAGQVSTALRNARLLDQIRHQALHDALTGLPNRSLILDRAEHLLLRCRRHHSPVAALFIDLDGFKDVNDTMGHAAGDQLLRSVAARLTAAVRDCDTIARLGGDEFVVLTEGLALDAAPELVAQRILDVLREPFHLDGRSTPLTVGASIGIAVGDRATAGELLRDADVALYQAKAAGKGRYVVFAPEMQTAVTDRATMEMDLRGALDRGEFFLVYQPIFDLRSGTITGAEALLRWRDVERGVVAPDRFIPILEDTGMIHDIGRWVLNEACRQTAAWHREGFAIDASVNVSARQLERDTLVTDVVEALTLSGLPATSLIVEITETTIMRDAEATVRRLKGLKELGVRIAIDDFGTGYSSLAYLQQFPVDALKIDRSFINAIADSPESAALIHTLVQLGKTLGLQTLAEGIEDDDQVDQLQREECDSGQGFLFARPLEPDDLRQLLGSGAQLPART